MFSDSNYVLYIQARNSGRDPNSGRFFKKARIRPKFLEQSPTWATNLQNNRSFIICTWFLDFWHLSWLGIIYWSVWTVFWVKLAVFIGNSDPKNQYLEKSRCNHPWIFSQLFDISRGNFFYRVPDICEGQEKTFYPIKSILTHPRQSNNGKNSANNECLIKLGHYYLT